MSIPAGYFYKSDSVRGSGYWSADGTGPYRYNGSEMTLAPNRFYTRTLVGTQVLQGTFWSDDGSGLKTVRS